jgi:uncharacterized protein YggE
MAYYGNEVINVVAKGAAETDFLSATFSVTVTTQGENGPAAKAKAKEAIDGIKDVISKYAKSAGIDTQRLKTTFVVDVDRDNYGKFVGYKAVYTNKFTCKDVRAATEVHDALTSLKGVAAATPIFNVDDSPAIHAKAFADAVEKAKIKFESHCTALGIDAKDFYVLSWSPQSEEPRGKTLGLIENPESKTIGIEPGKASLDMTVTFCYTRRAQVAQAG